MNGPGSGLSKSYHGAGTPLHRADAYHPQPLILPSIVRPDRNRAEDGVAVTHDQTFANPGLIAKTPFVKPPLYVDYGIRLQVGGSTFINRGCIIMDTPVADVVIGEGCNVGPNCTIVGVTRKSPQPPSLPQPPGAAPEAACRLIPALLPHD
jgi:hypothetical protein